MTQFPDLFAALAAPFSAQEVKLRTVAENLQLPYITARTAMNRLDAVLGPENWWDEYVPSGNSVICRLSIRLPDGSVVTKCDVGAPAGMHDSGDDDKSSFSDAFKRAAVKFGVARYLYRDGVPSYQVSGPDAAPASPAAEAPAPKSAPAPAPRLAPKDPPRTGKALFAWTRNQEQRHAAGLIKYLNQWGKLHEFPGRIVDWDADQVAEAYAELCRKIQVEENGQAEAREEVLAN